MPIDIAAAFGVKPDPVKEAEQKQFRDTVTALVQTASTSDYAALLDFVAANAPAFQSLSDALEKLGASMVSEARGAAVLGLQGQLANVLGGLNTIISITNAAQTDKAVA